MPNRPLISLCIPTYNRAKILKETLRHFSHNREIENDVEIIVSDNCSTDDTEAVVREFAADRPYVQYFKNESNIHDRNFICVLDHASGHYLKLLNDWVYINEDNLRYMKQCLRDNMENQRPVFFSNDWVFTRRKQEIMTCDNLDDYIQSISTFVTCNSIFGVWHEHWRDIKDKDKYASYKIMQVDWSYQIADMGKGCVIYDKRILDYSGEMRNLVRKGYNWFKIHLDNYYKIMSSYYQKGSVSAESMREDKKYLLEHFAPELCQIFIRHTNKKWQYDTTDTFELLKKYYAKEPFFYIFMACLPIRWVLHRHLRYNG